jgi:hypothetical protein
MGGGVVIEGCQQPAPSASGRGSTGCMGAPARGPADAQESKPIIRFAAGSDTIYVNRPDRLKFLRRGKRMHQTS